MAESYVVNVEVREETGTKRMRRLRARGKIPATVYGHGQDSVSVAVPAVEISAIVRKGHRLVQLQGGVSENAIINDVQWNAFGTDLLHVDFFRVSADERIRTTVAVECRGDAPGLHEGGIIDQPVHLIEIECTVSDIPERITVKLGDLHLGGSITAGELPLPNGAKLLVDSSLMIVHCVKPAGEAEVIEGVVSEPEVIVKKKAEEPGE